MLTRTLIASLALTAGTAGANVIFSDTFDGRTNGDATIGSLVSSWGSNDNALGGSIVQTYQTSNPFNNSVPVVRNNRGELGWAFTEIQHDFASNLAGGGLTIQFDMSFLNGGGGNVSWWMGTASGDIEPADITNGTKQIPLQFSGSDVGLLWRGGASTGGSFLAGVAVDNGFASGHVRTGGGSSAMRIDIFTNSAAAGSPATVRLTIDGNVTDINGAAAGTDLSFNWDAQGAAYTGFGSNVATYYAIDNLVVTAIPEPASLGMLAIGGLIALRRRRQA